MVETLLYSGMPGKAPLRRMQALPPQQPQFSQQATAPKFGFGLPPIVSKVVPNGNNFLYLMQLAAATRLATATARIALNFPPVLKAITVDPKVKENFNDRDQMLAFFERSFIELFDTFGFITVLHAGMDVVAKGLQLGLRKKLNYPEQTVSQLSDSTALTELLPDATTRKSVAEGLNKALRSVYGDEKNLIANIIAKGSNANKVKDIFKTEVADLLHSDKAEAVWSAIRKEPVFRNFIERTNFAAVGAIAFTVLIFGPVVAGLGVQYLNDKVYSNLVRPLAEKLVNKSKGLTTASEPRAVQGTIPSGSITSPPTTVMPAITSFPQTTQPTAAGNPITYSWSPELVRASVIPGAAAGAFNLNRIATTAIEGGLVK